MAAGLGERLDGAMSGPTLKPLNYLSLLLLCPRWGRNADRGEASGRRLLLRDVLGLRLAGTNGRDLHITKADTDWAESRR